jgi:hypothetical protein
LTNITRITPILWSDLEASTTLLLWGCRQVVDTFSHPCLRRQQGTIVFSSLRFCMCWLTPQSATVTCLRRRVAVPVRHRTAELPAEYGLSFAAPANRMKAHRCSDMSPDRGH